MTTLAYYTIVAATIAICLTSLFFGPIAFVNNCKKKGFVGSRLQFAFRIIATSQLVTLCLLCIFMLYGILTPSDASGIGGLVFLIYSFLFLIADAIALVILFVISLVLYPLIAKRALSLGVSIPENVSLKSGIYRDKNFFIAIIIFISFCIVILYAWPDMRYQLSSLIVSKVAKATGSTWLVKFEKNEYQRAQLYRYLAEKKQDSSTCDKIEIATYKNDCHLMLDR